MRIAPFTSLVLAVVFGLFRGAEATDVYIEGNASYQIDADRATVTLKAEKIINRRNSGVSGMLRLRLWATAARYSGGQIKGYILGTYTFPEKLKADFQFPTVEQTVPYSLPPYDAYFLTLTLTDSQAAGPESITSYATFSDRVVIGTGGVPSTTARNQLTFANSSGKDALVRLLGPSSGRVFVPNAQSRTVNVLAGSYTVRVRYGESGGHGFVKGETFEVQDNATSYSVMTVTLHKVANGNYGMVPISAADFDSEPSDDGRERTVAKVRSDAADDSVERPAETSAYNEGRNGGRSSSSFSMVILSLSTQDLAALLKAEVIKAGKLGQRPFVQFYADWCRPCRALRGSLNDPRMIDAFAGTYIIQLEADQWKGRLEGTGLSVDALPAFHEIDNRGRPTGRRIDGGAWGQDTPANMAPPLKAFFAVKPQGEDRLKTEKEGQPLYAPGGFF